MPSPVRVQVLCLPNVPWDDARRSASSRLEALGFDAAVAAGPFRRLDEPARPRGSKAWTALTGLAAATDDHPASRTCVTQIPFRNPAMFARQALTLDHVSNGRLEIGLGTGLVGDPSYAMIGRRGLGGEGARRPPRRVRRDRRSTAARRGDHVRGRRSTGSTGRSWNPRPVQSPRPPITVGALGPVTMRHASRSAPTPGAALSFQVVIR